MRSAPTATSKPPRHLGPYRIADVLGEGGMGIVYRGIHVISGQEVALKTVSRIAPADLVGLRHEIHALMRIRHPGVVGFVEQGIDAGLPWYAMELLRGDTLFDAMVAASAARSPAPAAAFARTAEVHVPPGDSAPYGGACHSGADCRGDDSGGAHGDHRHGDTAAPEFSSEDTDPGGKMTPAIARQHDADARAPSSSLLLSTPEFSWPQLWPLLDIVYHLCHTLAVLHGCGIVHRDLKPENVFLRTDGCPVLTDFGLVTHVASERGREILQTSGHLRGTPGFVAPEQAMGEMTDARADLYSLGCILYEIVTGGPPFQEKTAISILRAHISRPVKPPGQLVSGVPPALDQLIVRLLAKEPRARLGYADDVATVLAQVLASGRREWAASAVGGDGDRKRHRYASAHRGGGVDRMGAATVAASAAPRTYLYRPMLAGRTRLIAKLAARVSALEHGAGHGMILIEGVAGAGKTSLANALIGAVADEDVAVVTGACEAAQGLPLHPFAPFLRHVADRCVAEGEESIAVLLGPNARVLTTYEPLLAAVPGMDRQPETMPLPAQSAIERVVTTMVDVVARVSQARPLLMVLDDVQWADGLSERVLIALTRRAPKNVLVIAACRSGERTATIDALVASDSTERVPLGRLERDDVADMIADMLGMYRAPSSLVDSLWQLSAGNPYFVAEYLRTAVAEGVLQRHQGRWHVVAPALPLPIPATLTALIERRRARLSPLACAVVDSAAVLGGEIDSAVLCSVAGLEEDAFFDALDEIFAASVLQPLPAERVGFLHDVQCDVCYRAIPQERAAVLHRRAAQAIEATAHSLKQVYPELARHWRAAGDLARAVEALARAGIYAMRQYASDGERYLKEAVTLSDTLHGYQSPGSTIAGQRAHWHRLLGEARMAVGDYMGARAHLERALAHLGMPMPVHPGNMTIQFASALAAHGVRNSWSRVVHLLSDGASPASAEATAVDPSGGLASRAREAARCFTMLAGVYRPLGDHGRLLFCAVRALDLAEKYGPPGPLAMAYSVAQISVSALPVPALSAAYGRRARRTAQDCGDVVAMSLAHMIEGVIAVGRGQWRHGRQSVEQAMSIANAIGFARRVDETLITLAYAYLAEGKWQRARQCYLELYERGRTHASARNIAWSVSYLAWISLRTGQSPSPGGRDAAKAPTLAAVHRLGLHQLDPADRVPILALTALTELAQSAADDASDHSPTEALARARAAAKDASLLMDELRAGLIELAPPSAMVTEALILLWQRMDTAAGRAWAREHGYRALALLAASARRFAMMRPDAAYFRAAVVAIDGGMGRLCDVAAHRGFSGDGGSNGDGASEAGFSAATAAQVHKHLWQSLRAACAIGAPYQEARAHFSLAQLHAAQLASVAASARLPRLPLLRRRLPLLPLERRRVRRLSEKMRLHQSRGRALAKQLGARVTLWDGTVV